MGTSQRDSKKLDEFRTARTWSYVTLFFPKTRGYQTADLANCMIPEKKEEKSSKNIRGNVSSTNYNFLPLFLNLVKRS